MKYPGCPRIANVLVICTRVKSFLIIFFKMKTSWKKELESEEFSRTMGGRVEKYATQRYLMKTGRGPGTHEIPQWPDIILNEACKAVKRDVGFGTVPLFQPAWPSTTPGPGE